MLTPTFFCTALLNLFGQDRTFVATNIFYTKICEKAYENFEEVYNTTWWQKYHDVVWSFQVSYVHRQGPYNEIHLWCFLWLLHKRWGWQCHFSTIKNCTYSLYYWYWAIWGYKNPIPLHQATSNWLSMHKQQ